ncbi:biotin-dependent carboxyltransferase family protein [Polaribacter aestuariivivens]|uniref:Biotin-dependent carboxyltransferase family protein n=1 Tax=Polaribacter aestuariivivens TaxID=2304626 RepID=A0A5S3NEJ4_9FLAO|nr:biotin-dependent carboxyltransferase family protein [Polaribacter aestuariivivens]TMM32329.1 biotin-dependent carboxyltransferase family protein [Polaribacter aestuariivivens]
MIKVLKAGFFTTIQDKGRFGFSSIGVPFSGVMDTFSADLANTILNNNLDYAVLEIAFNNCSFQFLTATNICISGADFSPKINQKAIKLNQKIVIKKNDVLSFGKVNFGARTYVAVSNGILSEKVLNSRSMFAGITKSYTIKTGDILQINQNYNEENNTNASIKVNENYFKSKAIECFKGPEFDLLSKKQQKQLFETGFTISKDSDRMGYRLIEVLENNFPSILTSSVLPGTVQLTPSGKLIILMRDCQITGGYPRILQLNEASINRIAQKNTNEIVNFECLSV